MRGRNSVRRIIPCGDTYSSIQGNVSSQGSFVEITRRAIADDSIHTKPTIRSFASEWSTIVTFVLYLIELIESASELALFLPYRGVCLFPAMLGCDQPLRKFTSVGVVDGGVEKHSLDHLRIIREIDRPIREVTHLAV